MIEDMAAGLFRRAKRLKEDARQWHILYEEQAHYFHPIRKGFTTEITEGSEIREEIWNSWPEIARRQLSEFLASQMVPEDRQWICRKPEQEWLLSLDHIRQWYSTVSAMLYAAMTYEFSYFVERFYELLDDVSTFGAGVIYIDHDKPNARFTFKVKHLKNFYYELDANGNVTRQYCFDELTLDQLVEKFGLKALPQELRDVWNNPGGMNNRNQKYCILHAIIPNSDYQRFGFGAGRLPYKSIWIMEKGHHVLGDGGYYELPYVLVRWFRRSEEMPGRALTEQALPNARLLQAVTQSLLEITEKQANPPMQGPVDILRGEIELWPGGFTPFDSSGFQFQGDPLRPVQIGAQPALNAEYMDRLEMRIGQIFYSDLLSMPADGKSDEASEYRRQQLIAARVGPLAARIQDEILPFIIRRCYAIMDRARVFPPRPIELDGVRDVNDFDNGVADMREMNEAQRNLQVLGGTMELQIPEAVENVDWDYAIRDIHGKMKIPPQYHKPLEEVVASRQQRQEQQQTMAMAEMAKSAGPGLQKMVEGATQARDQGLLPSPQ